MISKFGEDFMPRRATPGSAGYDFYMPYDVTIHPGSTVVIDSGVSLEDGDLATNEVMCLFPRSSLGIQFGLRLKNTTGIIDSDYRDTIKIALTTDVKCTIQPGQRVMQGIIFKFGLIPNEIAPTTSRVGGIGSTGA